MQENSAEENSKESELTPEVPTSEETAKNASENGTEQEASETCSENPEQDKLAEMTAKAQEFQDLYLRKAADFENYRKRMIREKQEAGDYAVSKLISDLLPILDNFDRALQAKVEENPKAFADGVVMIKGQLEGMLERDYSLAPYTSKGEVFDPNIHEAVAQVPSTEVKVQTVGEEISKGYKFKDKVLRHAKVLVLMPTEENKQNIQTE